MEYKIIKFIFESGVHFGNGSLDKSGKSFSADTMFSALCIEALKKDDSVLDSLIRDTGNGKLLFSDAFPYIDRDYYIPKPYLYVHSDKNGDSVLKKRYKKLEYVNIRYLKEFLKGDYPEEAFSALNDLGVSEERTCVSIRGEEMTRPYRVGVYKYHENTGLYIIAAFEDVAVYARFEDLMKSLETCGIGGKRSAGLGKFRFVTYDVPDILKKRLSGNYDIYMSLSCSLPKEAELDQACRNAHYCMVKRGGYVQSFSYSDEFRKKADIYLFKSGSCFQEKYHGDLYDVSEGGKHPVYKYAMGFFVGLDGGQL